MPAVPELDRPVEARSAARSFVAEALVEPPELPVVCSQPELAAVPALPLSNRREVEAVLPVSAEC